MTIHDTKRSASRGRAIPDRWGRRAFAFAILVALAVWMALVALVDAAVDLDTGERGLLERAQTAMLALVAAVWGRRAAVPAPRSEPARRTAAAGWWASAPVLAVVGLAGLGREISWGAVWNLSAGAETALKLALSVLLVAAGLVATRRWWRIGPARCRLAWGMMGDRPALLILCGLAVFAGADLLENRVFGLDKAQRLEETLELFAYACVLGAGLARSVMCPKPDPAARISDWR